MKNITLMGFANDSMGNLCKDIQDYAEMFNLEILQISAYCDNDKVVDQRAIVMFKGERPYEI